MSKCVYIFLGHSVDPLILLKMFWALLCPSSGARDYKGDYSMWHITL